MSRRSARRQRAARLVIAAVLVGLGGASGIQAGAATNRAPRVTGTFAIRVDNGDYLTAVNGGGIGDPAGFTGNEWPVHTNATKIGPWEHWRLVALKHGKYALKAPDGHYLSAVNGGGITNGPTAPVNSNATTVGPWERFKIIPLPNNRYALQTSGGDYLTAVNGGGIGDPPELPPNSIAVHTNAPTKGPWEKLTLVHG